MAKTLIIFPNQLFLKHQGLSLRPDTVELIEESLFFKDREYPINHHRQKLMLHRSSMKAYAQQLKQQKFKVNYRNWKPEVLNTTLKQYQNASIIVMDPVDFALSKRLKETSEKFNIEITLIESELFINNSLKNRQYREGKKKWFMADFYKHQRSTLDVLMEYGKPKGGQWSFDEQNRKKIPKNQRQNIPVLPIPKENEWVVEAKEYVSANFPDSVGEIATAYFPVTHHEAEEWLHEFFRQRLVDFGAYEDALVANESWLYHSVLTPMLNIGLLKPMEIVDQAIEYAEANEVPINSLEGFLRQIIGWREFMRATYEDLGVTMRIGNYWQHHRDIPAGFYTGDTGITPLDDVIRRVLKTGYCHHIERLMVLGGFMFLCEFRPLQIYQWFMTMFVDAYDWVMVPNVFSMSQHADGGLITTKPYFSGSSYLRKMGYDQTGEWCEIWDGLYWRWIDKNSEKLSGNPRWAMMCSMAKKMDAAKMQRHRSNANAYLKTLN